MTAALDPIVPPVADAWEALLSAALVGTARRPAPPVAQAFLTLLDPAVSNRSSLRPSPGEAGPSPADAAGRDPEGEILAAAALLSAYRRAGRRPGEAPRAVPPAAEADVRPPCSEPAVEVLELILSGEVPLPGGPAPLAAEWLAGAARAVKATHRAGA